MLHKKDGELKISDRNILQEALSKLRYPYPNLPIKDKYGVIGYDIGRYILVAKPMLFNGIVSCNKEKIVYRAIQSACKILFYISARNRFYCFDPVEVLNHPESFLNRRKAIIMIYFPIELGHRISPIDVLKDQLILYG